MEERRNKLLYIVGIGVVGLLVLCIIILAILLHDSRKEEQELAEKATTQTEDFEEEMVDLPDTADSKAAQEKYDREQAETVESSPSRTQDSTAEKVTSSAPDQANGKSHKAVGTRDLPDLSDHHYQKISGGESLTLIFKNPSGEVTRQGKYLGEKEQGQPSGQGAFASENAEGIPWLYVGTFVEGKAEGSGIAVWADEDDYSDGKGYRQYFDGDFTAGAFVEGTIRAYSEHGQSSHKGPYPAQAPELPDLPDDFPEDFPKPSFPQPAQEDNFLEF